MYFIPIFKKIFEFVRDNDYKENTKEDNVYIYMPEANLIRGILVRVKPYLISENKFRVYSVLELLESCVVILH